MTRASQTWPQGDVPTKTNAVEPDACVYPSPFSSLKPIVTCLRVLGPQVDRAGRVLAELAGQAPEPHHASDGHAWAWESQTRMLAASGSAGSACRRARNSPDQDCESSPSCHQKEAVPRGSPGATGRLGGPRAAVAAQGEADGSQGPEWDAVDARPWDSASLTWFVTNELGAQSHSWDQMFPPKHRCLHLTLERRRM